MVMKTKYIFSIIAITVAVAACNTEKPVIEVTEAGEYVALTASIGTPGTKIHFTGDKDTYTETRWQDGDCIWVRSDTQPAWERGDCFKTSAAQISDDGHSAVFTGRTRVEGRLCAIYPYDIVQPGSDNDAVVLAIPDTNELVSGDCPASSNVAVAFWADGSNSFSMVYLLGALKVSVSGNGQTIVKAEITDSGESILWGDMKVVPDYGNKGISSAEISNSALNRSTATLTSEGQVLGSTPLEFYFMLPEGALTKGFVLRLTDSESKTYLFVSEKNNAIVRGKVVKMPAVDLANALSEEDLKNFSGGEGTQASPYQIATPDDLVQLTTRMANESKYDAFADKYYVQTADIDMDGKAFAAIGSTPGAPFKGVYDGGHFSVSNLSVQGVSSDAPASGLFGYADGATIKNLSVVNRSNPGAFVRVGGVVGYAKNSTIDDCHISGGELTAAANMLGGIVGDLVGGSVKNCTAAGVKLTQSKNYAAAIAAYAHDGAVIEHCKVLPGTVVSGANEIGGIVGKMEGGSIKECSAEELTISSSAEDVGAVGGWVISECTISDCVVSACSVTAGTNYGGGFVGLLQASLIKDCILTGKSTVTGKKNGTGGFVGYVKTTDQSTLDNCKMEGGCVITGVTNTGGLIGWLDAGSVKNCEVTGESVITSSGDGTGGLIGRAICKSGNGNTVDNCIVTGNTLIEGSYSLAGLLGYAYPDSNGELLILNSGVVNARIHGKSCDTNGDPASGDCMNGGIIGWARLSDSGSKAWIVNCYSYLDAMALDLNMSHPSVGGIVGYCSLSAAGKMEVFNCVSNFVKETITMAGSAFDPTVPKAGTLYGSLPNNAGVHVAGNYYLAGDLGEGMAGADAVIENNYGYIENVFKDGSTVKTKLNEYVAGQSTYTLKSWAVNASGLPVIE